MNNVVQFVQPTSIQPLSESELDLVEGGARVGVAGAGAAAAIWGVWVGAFTVGVSIGKDIGEAIFGKDND